MRRRLVNSFGISDERVNFYKDQLEDFFSTTVENDKSLFRFIARLRRTDVTVYLTKHSGILHPHDYLEFLDLAESKEATISSATLKTHLAIRHLLRERLIPRQIFERFAGDARKRIKQYLEQPSNEVGTTEGFIIEEPIILAAFGTKREDVALLREFFKKAQSSVTLALVYLEYHHAHNQIITNWDMGSLTGLVAKFHNGAPIPFDELLPSALEERLDSETSP